LWTSAQVITESRVKGRPGHKHKQTNNYNDTNIKIQQSENSMYQVEMFIICDTVRQGYRI